MSSGTDIKDLLNNTLVRDVMLNSFAEILRTGHLSEVQQKFVAYNTHYVVVVNKDRQVEGLISQKYLFKTQSPRKIINPGIGAGGGIIADKDSYYNKETLDSFYLENVMNKTPVTVLPDTPLSEAIKVMHKRKVGCIVVTNKSRIVQGIMTHQEVFDFFAALLG